MHYTKCQYVFMYVCMHVCMYVMYVCTYLRMYVCMHVCMYVCMYVPMYVCIYVCTYVRTHVCTHVSMYLTQSLLKVGSMSSKRCPKVGHMRAKPMVEIKTNQPNRWPKDKVGSMKPGTWTRRRNYKECSVRLKGQTQNMYLCMYVCMYVCVYVCMNECGCVCMYLCVYVSTYLFIYVSMCLCMYLTQSLLKAGSRSSKGCPKVGHMRAKPMVEIKSNQPNPWPKDKVGSV